MHRMTRAHVLAAGLCFALTACGGGQGTTQTKSQDTPPTSDASSTPEPNTTQSPVDGGIPVTYSIADATP